MPTWKVTFRNDKQRQAIPSSVEFYRTALVKPGGILSLSAVGGANFYRVGNLNFPCTRLNGQDVLTFLCENEFTDIDLRIR